MNWGTLRICLLFEPSRESIQAAYGRMHCARELFWGLSVVGVHCRRCLILEHMALSNKNVLSSQNRIDDATISRALATWLTMVRSDMEAMVRGGMPRGAVWSFSSKGWTFLGSDTSTSSRHHEIYVRRTLED